MLKSLSTSKRQFQTNTLTGRKRVNSKEEEEKTPNDSVRKTLLSTQEVEEVLKNEKLRAKALLTLKASHSTETLVCAVNCLLWEVEKDESKKQKLADNIVSKFASENAIYEVCIPMDIRNQVCNNPGQESFGILKNLMMTELKLNDIFNKTFLSIKQ